MPTSALAKATNILALLRLGGLDRKRSILPFLPRSLRFALLFILLLNYRTLPFVWHLRTFSSVIQVRLQGAFKWFNHDKRRRFVEHLSPVGENPFELTVTYSTTVGLSDCDYNGHLSNSSYAKNLDYARMKAAVICFPSILEANGWLGLGTSHFHFIREIPLWAEYEIRINIASWEDKWLNLVVQFVTYPNGKGYVEGTRVGPFTVERVKHVVKDVPIPDDEPIVSSSQTLPSTSSQGGIVTHSGACDPDDCNFEPRGRSRSPRPCYRTISTESSSSFSSSTSSTSTSSTPSSNSTHFISFASDDTENEGSETSSLATSPSPSLPSDSPRNSSPSKMFTSLPTPLSSITADTTTTTTAATTTTDTSHSARPTTSTKKKTAMPALPEGAVLHCVHVSSYCFKQGRITIPPRVALVVSGFGDRSKGRWERVQEIRDTRRQRGGSTSDSDDSLDGGVETKGVGGLRSILRGGWRKYEEEGLWNLDEYEEQRMRRVKAFGSLRTQMDDLRF